MRIFPVLAAALLWPSLALAQNASASVAIAKLQADQATLAADLAAFGGATVTVGTVTPAYQKLVQDAAAVGADVTALAALPAPAPSTSVLAASPDGTTIAPGNGTLTDAAGALWTITAGGQVTRNGAAVVGVTASNLIFSNDVVITTAAGVSEAWNGASGTFQPCQ